jgi:hypothetical protein
MSYTHSLATVQRIQFNYRYRRIPRATSHILSNRLRRRTGGSIGPLICGSQAALCARIDTPRHVYFPNTTASRTAPAGSRDSKGTSTHHVATNSTTHTPICSKRPSLPSMQLSARTFECLNEHGTHPPTPDLDVVVPALLRYLLHFTRHATKYRTMPAIQHAPTGYQQLKVPLAAIVDREPLKGGCAQGHNSSRTLAYNSSCVGSGNCAV